MPTETIPHQQVVELVMTLPADRLASVYDFARFVLSHPLEPIPAADIFGETAPPTRFAPMKNSGSSNLPPRATSCGKWRMKPPPNIALARPGRWNSRPCNYSGYHP